MLRIALAALGIALMFFVLMFGLVIGVVLLGLGALAWLIRQFTQGPHGAHASVAATPASTTTPGVIEGEYVVLSKRDGKAD